eukprot:8407726-Pyramimonas_sp.AAC.1
MEVAIALRAARRVARRLVIAAGSLPTSLTQLRPLPADRMARPAAPWLSRWRRRACSQSET